ncbi:MAG: hypothetical protein ABFD49_04345 [Armatimonadota bacterium]|nr:hypothetical protein [bacterium]
MNDDTNSLTVIILMLCAMLIIAGAGRLIRWIATNMSFGARNYSRMNPDEIVIIARFFDSNDAHRCKAILNHAGICCMVERSIVSQYHRRGMDLNPTYRAEVRAADAQHAIEVLSKIKAAAD